MTRTSTALAASVALVGRRAVTQAGLLAAVLVAVVVGTTLLGLCSLLLTAAQQQSLRAALGTAEPDRVEVHAAFTVLDGDPAGVSRDAARVLTDALDPVPATLATWATTTLRHLPLADALSRTGTAAGSDPVAGAVGYLVGLSDPASHARLVSGAWPRPPHDGRPWEVVVPARTAAALGLAVGDRVTLGAEVPGRSGRSPEVTTDPEVELQVVGVFTPRSGVGWDRDPLGGSGHDSAFWDVLWSGRTWDAYGPFVTDESALLGASAPRATDRVGVRRVVVTARPDLARADGKTLDRVVASVGPARREVQAVLGDRVELLDVGSALPTTVADVRRQQTVTGSGVLVVALIGVALAATALGLAGRLLDTHRAEETALLLSRGAGRRRLALHAAVESVALATVAAGAAVPLSLAVYGALGSSPPLAAAGWGPAPVSGTLVATVAASALTLSGLLVLSSWRAGRRPRRSRRRWDGDLARSGADLLLVALAVVALVQLRGHRLTTAGGPDPVLVAAPVLCVVAGSVLVLRALPLVLGWADLRAGRSRRLVLPLAAWDLARRHAAAGAAFVLVLASATGTFALSAAATWAGSQADQAAADVGTDLAVDPPPVAPLLQAAVLREAVGGAVLPVTHRPVLLGSGFASAQTPRLVAIDTRRADELLRGDLHASWDRGRAPSWGDVSSGLSPDTPVTGLPVAADRPRVTLTGTGAAGGLPLRATPTLVLEDGSGNRVPRTGDTFPLDGTPHRVDVPVDDVPEPPVRLVAVHLRFTADPDARFEPGERTSTATTRVAVAVDAAQGTGAGRTVGADGGPADAWQATDLSSAATRRVLPGTVGAVPGRAHTVRLDTALGTAALSYGPVEVVVTAFAAPDEIPVLVTEGLARATGLQPGDPLDLGVSYQSLRGRVHALVPYLPSVPRGPAVLADRDLLGRALLARGELEPPTDRWWSGDVASPARAAERIAALELGTASTREEVAADLRSGPVRVGVPAGLAVLVAAAGMLALVGTALHTAAVVRHRAVETARVEGLGVPRRTLVAALLVQHLALSLLAVFLGAAVGAVTSHAVSPWLTVSATGERPVPAPAVVWPWGPESVFLTSLVVGGVLVVGVLAARAVRTASAAHLRWDGPA